MSANPTTPVTSVDHIVLGLGGLGSAAAYWLQRMAPQATVIGVEQFELGHVNGASHDHSRIIRRSYHTPGYVRLTAGAYEAWDTVSAEAGEDLIVRTGGLDLFPLDAAIPIDDYTGSMTAEQVPFEVLDAAELMERWPQFTLPDGLVGLYQAETGIAAAGRGTAAHQRLAAARGATLIDQSPNTQVLSDGAGDIEVRLEDGRRFRTGSLSVCTDSWTNEILGQFEMQIPLEVTREQVVYCPTERLADFEIGSFPVWIWMDDPNFYGFPVFGDMGAVKVAEDVGGNTTTARTRTFDADTESLRRTQEFLARTIPAIATGTPRVSTCLYAMTPDRDFVLDTVPGHPGVQVALGSAHGFKFASWFGRTLAERHVLGGTDADLRPFVFDRPALTDPNYVPNYMT